MCEYTLYAQLHQILSTQNVNIHQIYLNHLPTYTKSMQASIGLQCYQTIKIPQPAYT